MQRTGWGGASPIALAVSAALAGAGVLPAPSRAAAAGAADASSGLQEVVVTARKTAENLQDVPVSIDVLTKKDLQNLAISNFDDYARQLPSVSFISEGPGSQLFVMRGASDGSNPDYPNTSVTGYFIDDMSMSASGAQPDLHVYDVDQIEVLNGPQGTTFGAGAMSGVIRYITRKPDLTAFSAGVDFDGGKIHGGQKNWDYEGFLNVPLLTDQLGLRLAAWSDSQGGFITNRLTTRTWVNGTVSNNAPWAGTNYNREHIEGARVGLKAQLGARWSALLSLNYQRQYTRGAWDEDPTLGPRTVDRFGPEQRNFQTRTAELRLDGDVGIGDLVFVTAYWAQPMRQFNEYSQYMENYNPGARSNPPTGFPGLQEGFTCLHDPYYSALVGSAVTTYAGCQSPEQFYGYQTHVERYSNELRLQSKKGGRFHWLAGLYWERTEDKGSGSDFYIPHLQYKGDAFYYYAHYYGISSPTLPPGMWYSYRSYSDQLDTTEFGNISFDLTAHLNVEAGAVHFHDDSRVSTPYLNFAYQPSIPSYAKDDSHKTNGRLGANYHLTDHFMLYGIFSQGFRAGGSNAGYSNKCYALGVPYKYSPDTINNYELGWKSSSPEARLVWNGAAYYMDWRDLQSLIYNPLVCAISSFNINVGNARIYGAESNIDWRPGQNWSLQAALSYTDPRIISSPLPQNQVYVNERLPFAPYFSWSWTARYEQPLRAGLRGYLQLDMAHKGDMWNDINPDIKKIPGPAGTGISRILQPAYSILNLRLGLNPEDSRWLTELYVTNLTDKNAVVYSNTFNYDVRLTTNMPRTIGVRLNYRFGKETNAE
ncbi:MAG: TonB-dependent receptor [Gammaproteobacteria bacterium]|nr:TonB-dependent receptor [Gammaproteobacteria bacterium]